MIVDVGVSAPAEATLVDLDDCTLVPGLIDCHQHLCFDGAARLRSRSPASTTATARPAGEAARRALRGGVTTLRDLGDRVRHARLARSGLPTILAAGPPITSKGGHCWYLGGECTGDGELRRAVEGRADADATS